MTDYKIIVKGDLGEAKIVVKPGDTTKDIVERYFKAFGDEPGNIRDWRLEYASKIYSASDPVFDRIPPNATVNLLSERVVGCS